MSRENVDVEAALERLRRAMDHLGAEEYLAVEQDLQHAHAALGGESLRDLYPARAFDEDEPEDGLEPREQCPNCSGLLVHESRDPLEEFCISPGCDYYRAE